MAHVPSGDTALLDLVHFDDALAAAQRPSANSSITPEDPIRTTKMK